MFSLNLIAPVTIVRELIPTLVLVCVVAGSWLLWRRTKRVPALLQLIPSAVLLLDVLLENIRTVLMICLVVFAVAYLCYALGRQRI